MIDLHVLLFQEGSSAPPSAPFGGQLWWFVGIFLIFYFLMIRPQMKEQKKRREMLAAIKKNDKVVTSGGLLGIVVALDDQEVTLRIDDANNVKARFTRSAIAAVVHPTDKADADDKGAGTKKLASPASN